MRYCLITQGLNDEFSGHSWKKYFQNQVNVMILNGSEPLGAPFVSGDFIIQAMLKPKRQRTAKEKSNELKKMNGHLV